MIERILNKALDHIILLYLVMFIITFGRVWAHMPATFKSISGYEVEYGMVEKSFCSFFGGLFWPLYWSVEAWT